MAGGFRSGSTNANRDVNDMNDRKRAKAKTARDGPAPKYARPFDWRKVASKRRRPQGTPPSAEAIKEKSKALARRQRLMVAHMTPQEQRFVEKVVKENVRPSTALYQMGYAKASVSTTKKEFLSDPNVTESIVFGLQAHRVSQIEMLRTANKRLMEFMDQETTKMEPAEKALCLKAISVFFQGLKDNAAISKFEAAMAEDAVEESLEDAAGVYLRSIATETEARQIDTAEVSDTDSSA